MDKVELIRKISSFHPGSQVGNARGWSWYVGGMKDTGDWNFWTMYDYASIEELQEGLRLIEEEFKPVVHEGPQKTNTELFKEWIDNKEKFLLWGKQI